MKILILGLNYDPELVGIGPYTAQLAQGLARRGHAVEVVAAQPYYPAWRRHPGESGRGYHTVVEQGVTITRCPLYVPRRPSGSRRIAHHLSFTATALMPVLRRRRQDVVFTVAPSLATVPLARLAARLGDARSWLHVQDFEVEAAIGTGLIAEDGRVSRTALGFESAALAGFDRYSSISPQMCRRLADKGISPERIIELRNWSDIAAIRPLVRPSAYVERWNIRTPHVALYSGNIANKQGIEIVVDAARLLRERRDLIFLICGEGPTRDALIARAAGLDNVRFELLQPRESLGELLGLATVHLLPQLADTADLVLPSKLANILASGRPVIATAAAGTGVAEEVEGCGLATPPGDPAAFAAAITSIIDDAPLRLAMGAAARRRAEERADRETILHRLDAELRALVAEGDTA